ncbi:MAG: efflux RND transporter periplasmic adaptor subunit [Leptolyngbya sp. PLA1]|nr:efflux RND transporter periplasmic adaptor subunit [Leptolyngbya sp. PLA1]
MNLTMRALGTLLLAPTVFASQPGGGPPPAVVVFDQARMEPVEQWREVTGELRALRRANVASRQGGQLTEVLIDDGAVVAKGQVIAHLDSSLAKLELERALAAERSRHESVAVRERELDRWKREWARYEKLEGNQSVSESEVDAVRSEVAVGEAALSLARAEAASAQADVSLARERLSQRSVVAPFAGRVVRKAREVGEWVGEGEAIAELVSLEELEARFDLPETLAAGVIEGSTPVRVRVKALGADLSGTISSVMPDVDTRSRLVPVRVLLANADGRLRPGMSVTGLVGTGSRAPSLTIHKDAILRDDAGEFIYWSPGGSAVPARIRTLFAVGDRVAVSAQIPPGADVIVKGNERVFPGQPVIDPSRPAAPKNAPPAPGGGPGEQPKAGGAH